MNGRTESAIKIENRIKERLQDLPDYVTDYYNNIAASKEPTTCWEYIRRVALMIETVSDDPKHFSAMKLTEPVLSQYMRTITRKTVDGQVMETSFSHRKVTWTVLANFCRYLYKRGWINSNPMELIDRPRNMDTISRKILTEDDLNEILSYIDEQMEEAGQWSSEAVRLYRDKAILVLFMNTGMRETALTEIDLADLNFEGRTLRVIDKRHKRLEYHLNEMTWRALISWCDKRIRFVSIGSQQRTDALFITEQGTRITPDIVFKLVGRYSMAALGYRITPHKFRAAFCSILYDKTRDIEFVRDAVGHSTTAVTQQYIVKKESAQRVASEMLESIFA